VFEKFRSILEDYQRTRFGLSALLGELDRVINAEETLKEKEFLPVHVRPAMEGPGVLAECLIQVDTSGRGRPSSYQP
jgi:hypothetical protein